MSKKNPVGAVLKPAYSVHDHHGGLCVRLVVSGSLGDASRWRLSAHSRLEPDHERPARLWHLGFYQKPDLPESLTRSGRQHTYISTFVNDRTYSQGHLAPAT